jgi:hypothetical protein
VALFKILKGNEAALPTTKTEGYVYVTEDTHKMYIDKSSTERFCLNTDQADKDSNGNIIVDTYMTKANPTGTGSFSLNRKSGSSIGQYSFGAGVDIAATNQAAHAEGYETTASGRAAHSEGRNTTASGAYSHAEGLGTTASAVGSHA